MSLVRRLLDYPANPDPVTAACNRIALIVAWNQPFYPLYMWWIVGGDWWTGCWTFLSTPFFAAVPAVGRRDRLAGRVLLLAAGIGNGMVSTKAFGEPSGVELFLIPCALIALLAFRETWRLTAALLAVIVVTALLHGHYGTPLGRFDAVQYARFHRLNLYSVVALSAVILWSLIRARASSARRGGPPSPRCW